MNRGLAQERIGYGSGISFLRDIEKVKHLKFLFICVRQEQYKYLMMKLSPFMKFQFTEIDYPWMSICNDEVHLVINSFRIEEFLSTF